MIGDFTEASARSGAWLRLRAALPYILAAGLFALGLYALYKLLAPVNLHDVAAQIRSTHWSTLSLAFIATLGGYLALAGYDWSALRYIGKPLPIPVVMTGGLMAYAFGNTIGLSAVSGGAVRWRIYSGLGLDGYDIAAVSTFAAVSYGVAATVVGLGALAAHPTALQAVIPFPPALVQLAAGAIVLAILLPLIWASVYQRQISIRKFTLRAPSLPILVGQIIFSLLDISLAALTLYLLLPSTELGFFTFVAVFAAATMAGILSHVPGGVGVFETVVIAAMPHGTPVDKVAAALLMFRMIYFLVPFILALIVLAAYETWRALGGQVPDSAIGRTLTSMEPALRAVSPLAPLVLAVMIFGSGVWMSISSLIPPTTDAAEAAEALFPLAFVETSTLLSSALGAALIVLALGIVRRSRAAFWLTAGAMGAGVLVSVAQGLDIDRAQTLAVALVLLLLFHRTFHRRAMLTHAALSPGWVVLVLTTIIAFGFMFFFAHKDMNYVSELWWQFALDERAPRAIRAGLVSSLLVGLAALYLLLSQPRFRPERPDAAAVAQAANIIRHYGKPEDGLALLVDKSLTFSDDARAFQIFAVSGRSWVACGGPVGPPDFAENVAWRFADAARRAGARPVFYQSGEVDAAIILDIGLTSHHLGDEAVINLERFSLDNHEALQASYTRAVTENIVLELMRPPHSEALIAELREVSDQWLATHGASEKSFSAGRFDPKWLRHWPLAVVRQEDKAVAFAVILEASGGTMAGVDIFRMVETAPECTIDFLFTELMLMLKAEGYASLSLGLTPISGRAPERSKRLWERYGTLLYRHGANFRNFQELRAFKSKFEPEWKPLYLATNSGARPLLALADVAKLISGEVKQNWRPMYSDEDGK